MSNLNKIYNANSNLNAWLITNTNTINSGLEKSKQFDSGDSETLVIPIVITHSLAWVKTLLCGGREIKHFIFNEHTNLIMHVDEYVYAVQTLWSPESYLYSLLVDLMWGIIHVAASPYCCDKHKLRYYCS